MKRVLALQHVRENPPGLVGEVLQENGIACKVVHVGEEALPDPSAYDALIAFGGKQHIYDEMQYPFSRSENALIREAVEQDLPFLGICYGSQLLAHILGGEVSKMPKAEIGFLHVEFTQEGKEDPLYANLQGFQQGFQWHEDHFELPANCVLLAHDKQGINQAFRYRKCAYGLQYHIELTREMMVCWLHEPELKQELVKLYGQETFNKIEHQRKSLYKRYYQDAHTVIENFLHIVRLL